MSVEGDWVVAHLSKLAPGANPHGEAAQGNVTPAPAATTRRSGSAQLWREALANEGGVVELVDQVLTGPALTVELVARVQALCSFHGELNDACREQSLGVDDTFEAVAVSPSECEACEVPPDRLLEGLENIWRNGWTPLASFWDGSAPAVPPTGPAAGVEFVAAWKLDDATAARIAAHWPSLTARYALAFRALALTDREGAITGFLLLVDPAAERPIMAVELLTEQWAARRAAAYLGQGQWQVLYLP
ncbi:MAG: hypothetical protein O3B31_03400 [Chloroflexi bacterium]|nr:hypothetical protein [Chloroflexota bacterium]MDA1002385.1 hypothetical protein [Chloroflexota bacterium]